MGVLHVLAYSQMFTQVYLCVCVKHRCPIVHNTDKGVHTAVVYLLYHAMGIAPSCTLRIGSSSASVYKVLRVQRNGMQWKHRALRMFARPFPARERHAQKLGRHVRLDIRGKPNARTISLDKRRGGGVIVISSPNCFKSLQRAQGACRSRCRRDGGHC